MFEFIKEFLKDPSRIGAVAPSGKALAKKMMEPIDFERAEVIVEYGPGTGSFTMELIARKRPETKLILIEQNRKFAKMLYKKIKLNKNIIFIRGTAAKVNTYLKDRGIDHVDYVVSGLPFTSLPGEISEKILTATQKALGEKGKFITFQYSLVKKAFFESYFKIVEFLRVLKNLPPAHVLIMQNKENTAG